jgi:DNA-binding LytR/AlgR family response regulator
VVAMLVIVYYGVNRTGALVTDVFTLAVIMYFIILFKSFILLIKHYFVDQHTIGELEEKQARLEVGYFTVRSNRQTTKIRFEDVIYIESLADYIRIHHEGGEPITSKEKISHIEQVLPDHFLRIHRSFIVNTRKITSYSREQVNMGELELPISRTYRREVAARL